MASTTLGELLIIVCGTAALLCPASGAVEENLMWSSDKLAHAHLVSNDMYTTPTSSVSGVWRPPSAPTLDGARPTRAYVLGT